MDAFEQVVAGLLFQEGFWVSQGFKVNLTKEEKKEVGRPSSPRWEIDLMAYSGKSNDLLVVECKSYLDSGGVVAADIVGDNEGASRYKLFVEEKLRNVVFQRLIRQTQDIGLTAEGVKPRLALAVGKFRSEKDRDALRGHFERMNWLLIEPQWIVSRLLSSADESYFDSISHVVSKLLTRNRVEQVAFKEVGEACQSLKNRIESCYRSGADRDPFS